jgi:transposase
MADRINQRLEEITVTTLIVGVDIAKTVHWARFVDYRGKEIGKAFSFKSNRQGFESIIAKIEEIRKIKVLRQPFDKVVIGMEPTGHYWKTFANHLTKTEYQTVCVNPYHTKKAKELDDNSQTANDKKDAITIARLVKDGRFFDPYLPQGVYAELRNLTNARGSTVKRLAAIKNTIIALLDEYFPEIFTVWKKPLKGKASRQILKSCPFPAYILAMSEENLLAEIRKAVKKTVGIQKVRQLMEAAQDSVGADYGLESARLRLCLLVDELEMAERHIAEIESSMEVMLKATNYAEIILSIKGIGVITAASFLGEAGDPLRFQSARQIANYAGYNLVEDSSGKSKSGTVISRRGRSQLRSVLYKMAFTMVAVNPEMKALHKYLTTREQNPLKKKQSLIVISKKIITVIHSLLKKQMMYNPALVLGRVRREMMPAA